MRKLHISILIAVLTLAILSWAVAQSSKPLDSAIDPDKAREIKAAGIENWQPFVKHANKAQPIAELKRQIAVPAKQMRDVGADDGIMQYDNGVLSALATNAWNNAGNKFTQGDTGSTLGTITLNSFSFYFMEDDSSDNDMWIQIGSVLNSHSYWSRESHNILGLVNSGPSFTSPVLNLIPQSLFESSGVFTNSFLLGFWQLNSNSTLPVNEETIPGSTNAVNLSDYHGWTGYSGASTTITYTMQPINFMLRARVSTASALPVELMAFDVK